mgnify:CR=1 FL=1
MKFKDDRMKTTTQAFNYIQNIKLYCWEKCFEKKIGDKFEQEFHCFFMSAFYYTIRGILSKLLIPFTIFITIFSYLLFNPNLDIANVMTVLYICYNLEEPLFFLFKAFSGFLTALVGVSRIDEFLI